MIDPLPFATSYLDWGHLDDAESICGRVLKAKPDDRSALYLMMRATNAHNAHARGLDHGARVENLKLAHLYVETPSRIAGLVHTGAACAPPGVTNGKPRGARGT
jgi:hypothetical protein